MQLPITGQYMPKRAQAKKSKNLTTFSVKEKSLYIGHKVNAQSEEVPEGRFQVEKNQLSLRILVHISL